MIHSAHGLFGSSVFTRSLFWFFSLAVTVYIARNYSTNINRTVDVFPSSIPFRFCLRKGTFDKILLLNLPDVLELFTSWMYAG